MATLIVSPHASAEQDLAPLSPYAELAGSPDTEKTPTRAEQIAHTFVLALMFAAPALLAVRAACVNDPDIWWHLRTGQWMVQHHAVPHFDPFSGPNAGKPWEPYSWLYELLTFQLFQHFGLAGIVGYTAGMIVAITAALWHLVKRLQADFSVVVLLIIAACCSFGRLYTPRPWMFTILFFVLQLDILLHTRKTGKTRELLWLPVIYALWANVHIQFVDGLLVLGLAIVESLAGRIGMGIRTRLRLPWLLAAFAASSVAVMANPFGWRIYRVAYDLASQPGVMDKIAELQAIPFRNITDFAVLFLALGAAAALAWHRRFQIFEVGLLIFAVTLSFRSMRDVWITATVSAALLATTIVGKHAVAVRTPRLSTPAAILGAALMVLGGFRYMQITNPMLQAQVAKTYPVDAVNFIRANGYAGPLFNDFNYGGYLIWALRMPVSIDGRAAFYGDKAIDRSVETWNVGPDWAGDPQLPSAGIVVGSVKSALVQMLRIDPRFKLVYEDKVAVVFVARK